jgi:two-component system sensor histidine kinase KdpD
LAAREYLAALIVVGVTTGVCLALRSRLATIDVAMLFLLAVVVAATRYRRPVAVFASLLSIAAFDFVFVPPYYTFDVHDTAYVLTFTVMLVVAFVMSHLTARIRLQATDSRSRERLAGALLDLDRELAAAGSSQALLDVTARHLGRAAGGLATIALPAESDTPDGLPNWPDAAPFDTTEVRVAAWWAFQHGAPAGLGTSHCGEADALLIPLGTRTRTLGVAAIRREPAGRCLTPEEYRTVTALAEPAAAALERAALSERGDAAKLEAEAERLRTSLLSSLSHDLRTPLSTIEGAASTLLQQESTLSSEVKQDMAQTIVEEVHRMSRLVSNLLDMIRVETGALAVHKEWQPLEEALGVALLRLDEALVHHPVAVHLPATLPLVPIDELLIEQVFINLVENATKYTPPGTPVSIRAWEEENAVVVEVADCGPGVPAGMEDTVFRKFYRASPGHVGGAGLGLTICRGIITAHGGRIWLDRRSGQGASFRFLLPLEGPPVRSEPAEAED